LTEFFGQEVSKLVLEAFEFLVRVGEVVGIGADAELVVRSYGGVGPGRDYKWKKNEGGEGNENLSEYRT
jgi:hypothetical protein